GRPHAREPDRVVAGGARERREPCGGGPVRPVRADGLHDGGGAGGAGADPRPAARRPRDPPPRRRAALVGRPRGPPSRGAPAGQGATADPALAAPAVTVLVAIAADERVAGLVTLVAAPTLARTRAWAEVLVVHPDFRGRGVGKALMAACAEEAADAGATTIDG